MEDKNKDAKVINLSKEAKVVSNKQMDKPNEKMSYEQLENIAHQLSEQSRQLYQKLQEANMANVFKRMDYLFKVVEFSSSFSDAFVLNCTSEIQDLITPDTTENKEKVE